MYNKGSKKNECVFFTMLEINMSGIGLYWIDTTFML